MRILISALALLLLISAAQAQFFPFPGPGRSGFAAGGCTINGSLDFSGASSCNMIFYVTGVVQ